MGFEALVSAALGYAVVGAVIAALAALIITPFARRAGSVAGARSVAYGLAGLGFIIGVAFVAQKPWIVGGPLPANSATTTVLGNGVAARPCTSATVELEVADFRALDAAKTPTASAAAADRLWRDEVECTAEDGKSLSDRDHGIWIDAELFGAAESALAYYDVKRYADSRTYVTRYQGMSPMWAQIAQKKRWTQMSAALVKVDAMVAALDTKLKAAGH
jgi:hypothetical protein